MDWLLCGGCPGSTAEEVQLECDYGKKVTPLYRAIENHQWASVNYFIKTGYWKNNFWADPVRPEIQAKTWMVRYDEGLLNEQPATKTTLCLSKKKEEKIITWKQLPMHAAIIYSAPAIIIQKLMRSYPAALRSMDNKGNLPIHLAFRHGSNDAVLALLLQEYPEGMNAREANGLLPTEVATELPSPQPLRGALLKTAMSKDDMDRKYIEKKVKEERFYFDDRPTTPHRGNLSPANRAAKEDLQQLDMLNQQIEDLRTSVDRVISKQTTPANAAQGQPHQVQSCNTVEETAFTRSKSKAPLSPSALESLQEMVTRTLAGPTAAEQLSPRAVGEEEEEEENIPANINASFSHAGQSLSMINNSLLESPSHQVLPTAPTSNSNILNPIPQPLPQRASPANRLPPTASPQTANPPLLRNLSYSSMQQQHQQHQQQLQQLQEQQQMQHQTLRDTATFEEQQERLDKEVRMMEDKMLQMECAMKEMHNREKTVRRELALTLKEVKHWKAKAKRAATEEEKNRILTEMLHELVPSTTTPRTTTAPRKQNKTPTTSAGPPPVSRADPHAQQKEEKARYRPTNMQKTQSEMPAQRRSRRSQEDDRKKHQSRHYHEDGRDDEVAAYRDYPPRSNRHSDVGVYHIASHYDVPVTEKDHGTRYNDAPPAIPLRRIQSEHRQRQGRSSDKDAGGYPSQNHISRRPNQSERNMSRGAGRRMEPKATRMERERGGGRRSAEPQGTHVESDSFVPPSPVYQVEPSEDISDTEEFTESIVDKMAALQVNQQNEQHKTRNYRRAEQLVQQRRRNAQEHGVWDSRDAEEAARSSPRTKHASYHRHARQTHRQRVMKASTQTPSGSSMGESSETEYYVIE